MTEETSSNHNYSITINQNSSNNKYETRKKKINLQTIGDKFSLTGKQCHYCKTALTVQDSNSCKSKLFIPKQRYLKIDAEKIHFRKKSCSKKFCNNCLLNNFFSLYETIKEPNWKCPCCADQCNCSSCKKVKSNNQKILNEKSLLSSESHLEYQTDNKSEVSCLKEITFDWSKLAKILGKSNKEKTLAMQKGKVEIVPETMFLRYKRAKDDYFDTIDKYKHLNEEKSKEHNEDDKKIIEDQDNERSM